MPRLQDARKEEFCKLTLQMSNAKAWREAYDSPNDDCARQKAYALMKQEEVQDRIDELKEKQYAKSDKRLEDYLRVLNEMAFEEGDYADRDIKDSDKLSAITKAMKALGIEGSDKVDIGGNGFQLIIHDRPEGEVDEEDKD